MTKLLIATDAWSPQINGVVRSLENIAAHAASFDMEVRFLTPSDFWTLPLPGYGEIRLALTNQRKIALSIKDFAPDFVHIATEGPIGLAARRACLRENRPFTTSYHTRFPEYVAARVPVPVRVSYAALRRFHNAAAGTMVSSPSLERVLARHGFRNLMRWSRGVDDTLFRPRTENVLSSLPRPIFLFVGRVAIEKNIEAFLKLDLPGSKVVVGNGPLQNRLTAAFPQAKFPRRALRRTAGPGLFLAPMSSFSRASPTRSASFFSKRWLRACPSRLSRSPARSTSSAIGLGRVGRDLRQAALGALDISRDHCRKHAAKFTWKESARQFFDNIRTAQLGHGAPVQNFSGIVELA